MSPSTKLDDKLEGIENFRAWKYIIGLILEENDLAQFIKEVVPEPEEDEAKEKYKKDMIRAKRIIADSIKDHLIPQVSYRDTPKEMFDALSRMYEEEPPKKLAKEEVEEYILFSALSEYVTPGSDTWMIDSGTSKHMTGQKKTLSSFEERDSPQKVSLGDDY